MWSQLVLTFLVAFACASQNPAWTQHQNYVYKIEGSSLVGLNQVSDEYSGLYIDAELTVQPQSDGNLIAKISNAQYAQIHRELEEGLETRIPQSELQYKKLSFSEKPFQIVLEKGVVRNVIVSKQIKNWEANMIKSIASQFQLDTQAKNLIPSSINILTQDDSNTAVFKTMEETVTGVAETLYEIHPYPEYILQSRPWVVPQKQLIEQGEVIEIVKNKNFTHSPQNPSFHYGLDGIEGYQPGNKVGKFLSRTSTSQVVITGNLNKFTIQSAVTEEQITLSPTLGDDQRGSAQNKLNLTLVSVQQQRDSQFEQIQDPVEVGVVYGYGSPYATENHPRPGQQYDHNVAPASAESQQNFENSYRELRRLPRSLEMGDQEWHQEKPQLSEPSHAPLLPLHVGYDGQSFKKTQNIVETVRKLAQEMGQEFSQPKETLQQQTAAKYITLVQLVRLMDQNEIEQVAQQLFGNSQSSSGWYAFRDAVGQCGTGAALYNIRQWIQNNKLSDIQAAHMVATAADAAREPTEQYMKFFFEMVQDEKIMTKPHLNESVLLSFTSLSHQVYGNRQQSKGKFPVYTYGTFRTSKGQEFVRKTVIPFLTTQLNEAINQNDNQKAHLYIQALGNVGQQQILEAFEPYLEGKKQASHFQRVLMIASLRKLVESNKKVARSVLYKVYQNPAEAEQVRVCAFNQLMLTEPSPSMLQRSALYTNVDANNYVNAAVKSAIQSAAQLQAPEHSKLRAAAQSAEPLLTNQEYGSQYSQNFLRSYIHEQVNLIYKQQFQTLAGKDHAVPKGFRYTLQKQLGGVNSNILRAQAIVSSMEDLINVFQQQTKQYQKQQQEKQSQQGNPWSSENLAKVLNMDNEQREQLEGNLYVQIGALQSILSFDNHTIENLPQVVQKLENELKQGKQSEYNKMMFGREYTFAVPTTLGLPFVFQSQTPILIKVKSEIRANADPQISNGNVLQKPDTVRADFDVNAVVTGRKQSEFGFCTPFDSQCYYAGYNKNFQVVVPLNGKLHLNVRKQQLQVDVQNPGSQQNIRLAHYSSWPYTAQHEIYNPKPNQKIIRSPNPYKRNIVVGDKAAGIGFNIQITSDERIDFAYLYEQYKQNDDVIATVLQPFVDSNIRFVHIDAGIDASKTTTQEVVLRLGYQSEYQQNDNAQKHASHKKVTEIPSFADDAEKRQQEFCEQLGRDISNAHVAVGDVTVEFLGQKKIKYSVTGGAAKSNVNPNGRFMAFVRKLENQQPQTMAYVQADGQVPNTNGLNLDYAMQLDSTSSFEVQGLFNHQQRLSKADAKIKLFRNQERLEYLQQQNQYKQCKEQMRQGNQQLPICAQATAESNFLNQFQVQMKYNDMDPRIINATYKVYSFLRHQLYPRVQENIVDPQPDNQLEIQGQFSPDLEHVNASVSTPYGQSEIQNAPLNRWARAFLVPHPVFHVKARIEAEMLQLNTFRPICVVDKNQASTFDNKTYPAQLSNDWTVVLQYVPRRPSPSSKNPDQSVPEQLKQTVESYALYARAAKQGSSQKEIQLVLQMPETQGKVVKIELKQSSGQGKGPKVLVNDQEVKYNDERSSDFYNGHIQIYALPHQEVKVEVRQAFYIIFDGETLKLTVVNSKFRDSARGLCGTFTGEPETDFAGPDNCIIRDSQQFVQSYTVGSQSRPVRQQVENKNCYQKKVIPANYISNQDAGRSSNYETRTNEDCTGHISRYQEKDGQICFTVRALPFCKPGCKPLQQTSKSVDVHCIEVSANTAFWRSQLDKKINVDFTMMQPTGKLNMLIPSRCIA